jgi:hypothetical protein
MSTQVPLDDMAHAKQQQRQEHAQPAPGWQTSPFALEHGETAVGTDPLTEFG